MLMRMGTGGGGGNPERQAEPTSRTDVVVDCAHRAVRPRRRRRHGRFW